MHTSSQFTDNEIILKVLEGQIALFENIIRRYNGFLYKTGRSYGYDHEDTQDLMQDTFVDVYLNLAKFENRASFKAWLIRIMLNNCYRKRQKFAFKYEHSADIDDYSIPMFMTNKSTNSETLLLQKELGKVIENALLEIPGNYRMVFALREISGLSVEETADAMNLSQSNVKVRLNRAKSMMRKEIEKSYATADIFEFNLKYCDGIVHRVMEKIVVMNG